MVIWLQIVAAAAAGLLLGGLSGLPRTLCATGALILVLTPVGIAAGASAAVGGALIVTFVVMLEAGYFLSVIARADLGTAPGEAPAAPHPFPGEVEAGSRSAQL